MANMPLRKADFSRDTKEIRLPQLGTGLRILGREFRSPTNHLVELPPTQGAIATLLVLAHVFK
jgi:hypothetical protein